MNLKGSNICLILPSLSSGGMERVMLQLAEYFVKGKQSHVTLLLMTKRERFYELPDGVVLVEPPFDYRNFIRLVFTFKIFFFVRTIIKNLKPDAILSFGGKYNAFVILALWGLKFPVFISDRSRPSISYGRLLDFINPIVYKYANGIIAQTSRSLFILKQKTHHANIRVIGNPIRSIEPSNVKRENIILSVGRFIPSKNQQWLVNYFNAINKPDWRLIFLGDGELLQDVKTAASQSVAADRIDFLGNRSDVETYYNRSKIFAFASTSEGFPNALGEAMAAGMACISFNCEAGPADIIEHEQSGILITEGDHESYKKYLALLMNDDQRIEMLGRNAVQSMKRFDASVIGDAFYEFINIK